MNTAGIFSIQFQPTGTPIGEYYRDWYPVINDFVQIVHDSKGGIEIWARLE